MERLTEKCWRNLDPWECCGQDKYCQRGCHDEGGCANGCKVPKMYCKLAKYEDLEEQCIAENQCGIGELLMKWKAFFDDIAELYDYRKAEEQGVLLQFKCKVGDTVYHLMGDNQIDSYKVMAIEVGEDGVKYFIENSRSAMWRSEKWFDKAVFLTYEAAETALAEHKKGGAE